MADTAPFRRLIQRLRRAAAHSAERSDHWLPDFCGIGQVALFLLLAESVYLIVFFGPGSRSDWSFSRLVAGSSFTLWTALVCVVVLCKLRPWLVARGWPWTEIGAWLVIPVLTLLASVAVVPLSSELAFNATAGLAEESSFLLHFIVGNTAIAALASGVLFRYLYISAASRRNERGQARAEIVALQARIRPHFLFNSMNTIASLIPLRPADAERAIEDLSELFRAALAPAERLSTLGAELELVRRYLEIEHLRLGDRLGIAWPEGDVPIETPMPALLLQPLVENAVHHGISALPEGGCIDITCVADATEVRLRIVNPRPLQPQAIRSGHGIALENVRQRLAFHYGDAARLLVHDEGARFVCDVVVPR